jgi:preprotein translocase subunit SecD
MRRKKAIIELSAIVLVAILALGWTFKVDNKPFLGLDLQGGLSVVLKPDTTDDEAISQAIVIMNQRINSLGVAEPTSTAGATTSSCRSPAWTTSRRRSTSSARPPSCGSSRCSPPSRPTAQPGPPPAPRPAAPGHHAHRHRAGRPSATTVAPSPAAVSPGTSEVAPAAGGTINGMGAAEGESAAGAQAPPTTISDQNPSTTAGVTPAPSTTVAAVPAGGTDGCAAIPPRRPRSTRRRR